MADYSRGEQRASDVRAVNEPSRSFTVPGGRFLNVKALVGAFNKEKALVEAFSVMVKTDCETDGSFYITSVNASQPRHNECRHSP